MKWFAAIRFCGLKPFHSIQAKQSSVMQLLQELCKLVVSFQTFRSASNQLFH